MQQTKNSSSGAVPHGRLSFALPRWITHTIPKERRSGRLARFGGLQGITYFDQSSITSGKIVSVDGMQ
jgi:hypothetical protein